MKKANYKELSKKRCIDCGKRLKVNLLAKNPTAKRCYKCHKARQDQKKQNNSRTGN